MYAPNSAEPLSIEAHYLVLAAQLYISTHKIITVATLLPCAEMPRITHGPGQTETEEKLPHSSYDTVATVAQKCTPPPPLPSPRPFIDAIVWYCTVDIGPSLRLATHLLPLDPSILVVHQQ